MKVYAVIIEGITSLLQHRHPLPDEDEPQKPQTGLPNWSAEAESYIYRLKDGTIGHPGEHIEKAMERASLDYKIPGKRGKTYRDLFRACVFCHPEMIPLLPTRTEPDYIDKRYVRVSQNRVVRHRPAYNAGWRMAFEIHVLDDQIPKEIVRSALTDAGKRVGIGDFRPKFGRFIVVQFEEIADSN